jgi:hypothetical protein
MFKLKHRVYGPILEFIIKPMVSFEPFSQLNNSRSVASVREQVSRGQRDGSLRPYSWLSSPVYCSNTYFNIISQSMPKTTKWILLSFRNEISDDERQREAVCSLQSIYCTFHELRIPDRMLPLLRRNVPYWSGNTPLIQFHCWVARR